MASLAFGWLLVAFLAAAAATWLAGIYLSKATDVLDARLNLGQAVGGMVLLGLAGSLPELAITASAALSGHLELATGNLLGGIAMQTLVLVLLDGTSRRSTPLSSLATDSSPLIEAALVIVLVTLAIMGGLLPESSSLGPVSSMSLAIPVFFLAGMTGLNAARRRTTWQPAAPTPDKTDPADVPNRLKNSSTAVVAGVLGVAALVTLVAGVGLEETGNQLADDLGMNGVVFGATILAAVTALPEISSGIEAVRLGAVELAMSDVYGGNAVQLNFFLLADLLSGNPVLPAASAQSLWLGGAGAVVTAMLIFGMVMRPQRKLAGLGPDSLAVLAAYVGAVWLLTSVPD